jgi:hypothetical protein
MDTPLKGSAVIEDGIPVPPTRNDYSVLDLLEPGQSVVLPGIPVQRAVTAAARRAVKFPGRTYTCRTVGGGIRVWRVT